MPNQPDHRIGRFKADGGLQGSGGLGKSGGLKTGGLKTGGLEVGRLNDPAKRIGNIERGDPGKVLEAVIESDVGGDSSAFHPNFSKKKDQWYAIHEPGVLAEVYPGDGTPAENHIGYIDGVSMLKRNDVTNLYPLLPLLAGVQTVYGHFKTTEQGKPKELAPAGGIVLEVESAEEEKASEHHELLDGSGGGGAPGDYWIPLYTTKLDDNDNLIIDPDKPTRFGNIEWVKGHNQLRNVGAGAESYIDYEVGEDVKRLRGHLGGYGILAENQGNDIQYDARTVSVGPETAIDIITNPGDGDPALFGDPMYFRKIMDRYEVTEDKKINVVLEPDPEADPLNPSSAILVKGNDFTPGATTGIATDVGVQDGLIYEMTTLEGKDLNLIVSQESYSLVTAGGVSNLMQINSGSGTITYYWRSGVYLGASQGIGAIADPLGNPHIVTVDRWTDVTPTPT